MKSDYEALSIRAIFAAGFIMGCFAGFIVAVLV